MSKYLEDWVIGETYLTPGRTITEADVGTFAGLTGDYHPNHTDQTYMEQSQFGSRIAHGLFGISVAHGLLFRLDFITESAIAFLKIEDWTFKAPIFFGDTVKARLTVADVVPSKSKPDRGILKLHFELVKQCGTVCQEGTKLIMIKRRPGEES